MLGNFQKSLTFSQKKNHRATVRNEDDQQEENH